MEGQLESDPSKLLRFKQPSSLCRASQNFYPAIGELNEFLPCTNDIRISGPGTRSLKLKLGKDRLGSLKERVNRLTYASPICFYFRKVFIVLMRKPL